MSMDPKEKILEIVATLKKSEKHRLAKCIEDNWHKSALTYSKELNTYQPKRPLEKEMLLAFSMELGRLNTPESEKTGILSSLNKRRILQTAPHLVATESPRMLCINWLGSLGTPNDEYYVVGMFSGIPFSNNSHPGRINGQAGSTNLFRSTMQDGLVYRSLITDKLTEVFPNETVGQSYTKWALLFCQKIERQILGKNNLIYLDINEVVTNYLIQVLQNPDHIMYKILFDKDTKEDFASAFPDETLFYMPVMMSRFETTRKVKAQDLSDAESLIENLQNKRYCPALITLFICIAFLNEFKCFGSFRQVEYLAIYQEKLSKLKILTNLDIQEVPTSNLTLGNFSGEANMYPADIINIIEKGGKFKISEDVLLGELLLNAQKSFIENINHEK